MLITHGCLHPSAFPVHCTQSGLRGNCDRLWKAAFKEVGCAEQDTQASRKQTFGSVTQNREFRLAHFQVWFTIKNLLMPLFLMGCFPVDFQEVKRPLQTKSVKRPIKVGKRPINEGKRPIKAMVLVGISVGCLMGCFRATRPWWKTAP